MSAIKTIQVLTPNPIVVKQPIMTQIAKPTLPNTQFKPVPKPTTPAVPPFPRPTIQPITTTQPVATPAKIPTTPTLTEYLPLITLVVIGGFILSRN